VISVKMAIMTFQVAHVSKIYNLFAKPDSKIIGSSIINVYFAVLIIWLDCNCDVRGTREGICDKSNGQCMCREGYGGERCDQCLPEFFGYPDCEPCSCSLKGSIGKICDATGKCGKHEQR